MKKVFYFPFIIFSSTLIPCFTVFSCNKKETNKLINYNGTQESLNQITENISFKDFSVDYNKKLNEVKSYDIKWNNANNYPKLNLTIFILTKEREKDVFGEKRKNVISFNFIINDIEKSFSASSKKHFIFEGLMIKIKLYFFYI